MAITLNDAAREAVQKVLNEMVERGEPVWLPEEESPETIDLKAFTLTDVGGEYTKEQVDEGARFWGDVDREVDKERERREFIRRAAVALYADSGAERSPDESWQQAQWLWGAKPEDC